MCQIEFGEIARTEEAVQDFVNARKRVRYTDGVAVQSAVVDAHAERAIRLARSRMIWRRLASSRSDRLP